MNNPTVDITQPLPGPNGYKADIQKMRSTQPRLDFPDPASTTRGINGAPYDAGDPFAPDERRRECRFCRAQYPNPGGEWSVDKTGNHKHAPEPFKMPKYEPYDSRLASDTGGTMGRFKDSKLIDGFESGAGSGAGYVCSRNDKAGENTICGGGEIIRVILYIILAFSFVNAALMFQILSKVSKIQTAIKK